MIASAAVVSEREAAAAGCAMQETTAMASIVFCITLTSLIPKRDKGSFGFVQWVEAMGFDAARAARDARDFRVCPEKSARTPFALDTI